MTTHPSSSRRLADKLNQRRIALRLEWKDVADRTGVSTAHLRNFRNGQGTLSDLRKANLEDALQWQQGSIDRISQGGEPIEVASVSGTAGLALGAHAESSDAIEAALRELARRLPPARVQAVLGEFVPTVARENAPAVERLYEDDTEQRIWEIAEIEPVIRRQLVFTLRNAREALAAEDLRPDADVRAFRPRSS
jgi:hypothetical protein